MERDPPWPSEQGRRPRRLRRRGPVAACRDSARRLLTACPLLARCWVWTALVASRRERSHRIVQQRVRPPGRPPRTRAEASRRTPATHGSRARSARACAATSGSPAQAPGASPGAQRSQLCHPASSQSPGPREGSPRQERSTTRGPCHSATRGPPTGDADPRRLRNCKSNPASAPRPAPHPRACRPLREPNGTSRLEAASRRRWSRSARTPDARHAAETEPRRTRA
mmetsp:Transcript_80915/g.234591  ORF Transcript_80915/g.234591 Transcript_80915/m.234591 type:complete len:226 (+) Transcript_80915:523-1200(+)